MYSRKNPGIVKACHVIPYPNATGEGQDNEICIPLKLTIKCHRFGTLKHLPLTMLYFLKHEIQPSTEVYVIWIQNDPIGQQTRGSIYRSRPLAMAVLK